MEGFHDVLNVRLGKPIIKEDSYARFLSGELQGRHHPSCLVCFGMRSALSAIRAMTGTDGSGPDLRRPRSLDGRPPSNDQNRGLGVPDEEFGRGELGMTLNVLRLPPLIAKKTPARRSPGEPPPVLRRAMDRADLEQRRVLGEVREGFYLGVAGPTVLPVDERVVERLRTTLEFSEKAVGILGPETIRRDEAVYSIWVRLWPCG